MPRSVRKGPFIDHHLANTESVVLAPVDGQRWECLQWGAVSPPFHAEPSAVTVRDGGASMSADPMG